MSRSRNSIKRTALLILGMHRSGTSALSGVLAKLGAEAPRTLMPPTTDNPKGYWESTAIMEFNNAVLASAGSRWDEWEEFNREWLDSGSGKSAMSKLPALLEQEFGNAPLFVVKDPRICRLLPAWLHAFDKMNVQVKVVLPFRNPIEVVQSLEARNRITRMQALLMWLRHVLDAEHASRGRDRIFVRYADLLADWRLETSRIGKVLGIEWPRMSGRTEVEVDAYLDKALKHHAMEQKLPTGNPILSWVAETHAALCDLVEGRDEKVSRDQLDAVRRAFDASSNAFAPLFHEVRKELMGRLDAKSADVTRVANEAKDLRAENVSLKQRQATEEGVLLKQNAELEAAKKQLKVQETALGHNAAEHRLIRDELVVTKKELASATATFQGQIAALQRECADFKKRSEDMSEKLAVAERRARDIAIERSRMEELNKEQIASLNDRLGAQIKNLDDRKQNAEAQAKERLVEVIALSKRVVELEDASSAGKSTISTLKAELERCRTVQTGQLASMARERRKMEERDGRIHALAAELSAQSGVILGYRQALETIRTGSRWTLSGELRRTAGKAIEVRGAERSTGEVEALLRKSKLFDADWYLTQYPDVRTRKMDPVKHYLQYGASEGRDPGPAFSTSGYCAGSPDVVAAGINPLLHYLLYGRKEGRGIVTLKSRQEDMKR